MRQKAKCAISPALKRIKFYFDLLKQTTDNYLFAMDMATKVAFLSPNYVTDFGLPAESLTLENFLRVWYPLIHPDDFPRVQVDLNEVLQERAKDNHDVEYRVKNRRGNYVWIRCRGKISAPPEAPEQLFFAGVIRRLAERNQADEVTGLLNVRAFFHEIKMSLGRAAEHGETGAVMVLGIDNFKMINEAHGIRFGNRVLQEIARRLELVLGEGRLLYRLDGDKFGVLFPQATVQTMDTMYQSMQTSLNRLHTLEGKKYFCTVSAGTVFYPEAAKDAQTLYKYAEAALDNAKRGGKNKNRFFSKGVYNRWNRSFSLRDDLWKSVRNGCEGFSLRYQPQIDAKTKQLIGAEALLRWQSTSGHMVSPADFIPILEDTKLIIPVGKWVLQEAMSICRKWQEFLPGFAMSINMSYEQLKDPTFCNEALNCADHCGIAPGMVTLELTESMIVSDWSFINQQFTSFRERGLKIAMDDFGTGYSSLSTLKNLACDIVKIDREFVKAILENSFDRNLIRYTAELCHSVGMKVCVEGVEEEAEYRVLTESCKADSIQGYLFGRPETETDFETHFFPPAITASV